MTSSSSIKRTDQQICVEAVRETRRVLGQFSKPGRLHDAAASLFEIMEILDNRTIDAAMERIDNRKHFAVVTFEYYGRIDDEEKRP